MLISNTGRRFLRHTDGTVMLWKDRGVNRETLILDSVYRQYLKWFSSNSEIEGLVSCAEGYGYINDARETRNNPKSSIQSVLNKIGNDEYLDSRFFYKDVNTSQFNTECIKSKNSSELLASSYCGSLNASLPNLQTLVRIYCDGPIIDQLDSSSKYYPDKSLTVSLGGWFYSDIPFAWSSSEFDYYYAWTVLSTGLVGTVGKSDLIGGVIPVIEIK